MPASTGGSSSGPADRISFTEPGRPRRFSNATTGTDNEFEENVYEDWSKVTHEDDSWATRERRRSSKFSVIDADIARQKLERQRGKNRTASSSLGIFSHGVDKQGNPVLLSDDTTAEWLENMPIVEVNNDGRKAVVAPSLAAVVNYSPDERKRSVSSQNSDKRRGSILSLWKTGKDRAGQDYIHAGHEDGDDDWAVGEEEDNDATNSVHSKSSAGGPAVGADPRGDRRGSILSIWKQAKDREGQTVIMSGEEHDETVPLVDDNGQVILVEKREVPLTSVQDPGLQGGLRGRTESAGSAGRERLGSVLSIWSQGTDKQGNVVVHSGEEHDGVIEVPVDSLGELSLSKTASNSSKAGNRGQARRGSVLSMWSEEKFDTQERPAPVALKDADAEPGEGHGADANSDGDEQVDGEKAGSNALNGSARGKEKERAS